MTQSMIVAPRLFDVSQQAHQLPQTHSILSTDLDLMFIYIMRIPAVFLEAMAHIEPEYFDNEEIQYAIFWNTVRDLRRAYHQVSFDMVATEINRRLTLNPIVSDEVRCSMLQPNSNGLVWMAMQQPVDPQDLNGTYARDLMRRFLHERTVIRPLARVASQARGNTYPQEFMQFLKAAVDQNSRIDGIRDIPIGGAMPARGSELPAPIQYVPTGMSFVDNYIKGQRQGDCNGLLGVFGAGKTTMGLQITLENAMNSYTQAMINGTTPELNVFLSYEEPQSKVEKRIWSYAARIRRDKLEEMRDWNVLTTQNNMEDYERGLSAAGPNGVLYSETERWDIARQWLNSSFVLLDMSGSENYPNAGAGYVDEAAAMLTRLAETRQQKLRCITMDYAGLMCKRHMGANGVNEERMRYYLANLGDSLRRTIAEKHQATVWLLHQFNGDQNKRSPTVLLHHSDAAESKAFAENLAVCGCLGVEDKATGCRLLNWSKVRYYNDRSQSAPTLQIDGMFGGMRDVSNRFTPDANTRTFIDPHSRSALEGEAPQPVRRGPPGLRPNLLAGAGAGDSEF